MNLSKLRQRLALMFAVNMLVVTGVLLGVNEWLRPGSVNRWICAAAIATFACGGAIGYAIGHLHGTKGDA